MQLVKKQISYLNRDFGSMRQALIDFTKNYFPDTYQDYNETSAGMMFLETAAYVGDVLSYYTDVVLKESFLLEADERPNLLRHAQSVGYRPKNSVAASVTLDVYQLVPAIGSGVNNVPDWSYAYVVEPGMTVSSTSQGASNFRTQDFVDFRFSSSLSPTEVTVYRVDGITNEPTFYLLKKQVKATSGTLMSVSFDFESPKPYDKVYFEDPNFIEITHAEDSDGNRWEHVPYLSQNTIFEAVQNIPRNDRELNTFRNETPYLLKLKKVTRRFTSRVTHHNQIEIQFGAGITGFDDEELIPNPDLVGNSLTGLETSISLDIDPTNFLYTKTYGLAPSNTTLRVFYTSGGGVTDNVPSNTLQDIISYSIIIDDTALDATLLAQVKASLAVDNQEPATGGRGAETMEEVRMNSVASFAAQNRAVTKADYLMRVYSMPQKFGSVSKAYITRDTQTQQTSMFNTSRVENPLAMNMYVLGYDKDNKLTAINDATKENLKTYLSYHRMLTDAVNIKDAYIINFGIDFEIITLPQYNSNQVLIKCLDKLRKYFDINKWQIGQPIAISNVYTELDRTDGVQTVVSVKFYNLYDSSRGYSGNAYDFDFATRDGVIFPSLDPSIFELKYPSTDIRGRVKGFNI